MTKRWLGPWVLIAALTPTLSALWQDSYADAPQDVWPMSERERVLRRIDSNPSVLINITRADMPASPDILHFGKRATRALERCLADNVDADIRITCAVTLHALGDRRALPTLQAALDDWEPAVRYEVVRALGAMPDASSVEPLIELYRRKDETKYVKMAVLQAFASISDKRVVRLLRGEITKRPKERRAGLSPQRVRCVVGQPSPDGEDDVGW